ncbi:MAG: YbaB/EbfC family nucleoid-associated protein, partial [Oscillospiraceae bacterium]|nr:YbaB/EbfC family nucleoid-associated protein [Oscillospiraceae bacterium]
PEVVDPEDTEMLGDLVAAAVNAAVEAASKDYEERMGSITGGIDIPGLR